MRSDSTPTVPWTKICYGIDSNKNGFNVVRAERSGRKVSFETLPFDSIAIAQAVACGAAVSVGMPVGKAISTKISAPFKSETKAQRVFPTLLDIQLPFPLEDCIYSFTETSQELSSESPQRAESNKEIAPPKSNGISTLAIAARKTDIEKRLHELSSEGIDPHVLDCEGIALWTQLLHEIPAQKSEQNDSAPLKVIIFLRDDEGIAVIGRGSKFSSAHRISPSAPATLDRCIQSQLNKLGVNNNSNQPDIEWFWAGDRVQDSKPGQTLKSHISKRWIGKSTAIDDPETFLARALAMRAILPGQLRTNLLKDEFSHSGAQRHLLNAKTRSTITILIAGLILCGTSAGWDYNIANYRKSIKKQFKARATKILGYTPKAQGAELLLITEREFENIAEQQKPLTATFQPSLLTELQQTILLANKYNINIEQLELKSDMLQIHGSFLLEENIQDVVSILEDLGYKLELTFNKAKSGDRHIFSINAINGGVE